MTVAATHRLDAAVARGDLIRALGAFCDPPAAHHRHLVQALGLPEAVTTAEHTEAFVLQGHPYASFHLSDEGSIGGQVAEAVGGFWRVLGLEVPAEPDHLAALLGLYAALLEVETDAGAPPPPGPGATEPRRARAIAARSRATLLWEHLVPWVPGFADSVAAAVPAYSGWARLLTAVLLEEATTTPPPRLLPAALRQAPPGLMAPEHQGVDPVASLVAPIRCGMVLTRSDLARAAESLGLGLRVGGRRFVLEALLGQEPSGVFAWMEAEAQRWSQRHAAREPALGEVARFWATRAAQSARWLRRASALPARGAPR